MVGGWVPRNAARNPHSGASLSERRSETNQVSTSSAASTPGGAHHIAPRAREGLDQDRTRLSAAPGCRVCGSDAHAPPSFPPPAFVPSCHDHIPQIAPFDHAPPERAQLLPTPHFNAAIPWTHMPSITLQPLQPHRQQQQCLPSTPTTSPTRAQWTAPPLSPTVVVPRRLCRANADIEFLQRVDCVRITDITERDGVVYYCLDVYLYEEVNRIPTNKHRSSDAGLHLNWDARQPTYRVERRFSEFEVLRKAMSHYVNLSHSLPCDYCDEFASFFFLSVNQPRMFVKWTTGASKRKGILARFLNHSIVLGRERRSHCPYLCESHERIPMMLRRFLKTSCIQFTETLV